MDFYGEWKAIGNAGTKKTRLLKGLSGIFDGLFQNIAQNRTSDRQYFSFHYSDDWFQIAFRLG